MTTESRTQEWSRALEDHDAAVQRVNDTLATFREQLAEAESHFALAHIGELAVAYVSEPVENSDRVTERYYELEAAVRHMQAVDARSTDLAREVACHQSALRDRIRPQAKP